MTVSVQIGNDNCKDTLTKKIKKNHEQIPQYYIEGHHEPMIPKELLLKVQEEIARRGSERDCLGKKRGKVNQ